MPRLCKAAKTNTIDKNQRNAIHAIGWSVSGVDEGLAHFVRPPLPAPRRCVMSTDNVLHFPLKERIALKMKQEKQITPKPVEKNQGAPVGRGKNLFEGIFTDPFEGVFN